MQDKCGLVDPARSRAGPSPKGPLPFARRRCPKKAKALVAMGHLTTDGKTFSADYRHTVRELVDAKHDDLAAAIDQRIVELRRGQPTQPRGPSPGVS